MADGEKIAVIDLGTNTFHLLICKQENGEVIPVLKDKIIVKIGQDGISENRLTEKAYIKTFSALTHFKDIIDKHNIKKVTATATSAIRNAINGPDLIQDIKTQLDIDVAVIDGSTEATLIYHGVSNAINLGDTPALIMDIGGGSVEFIICTQNKILWKESFEIGAQRLLDEYHTVDPIPEDSINALDQYLDSRLATLKEAVTLYNPHTLVGSSGTFDTYGDIYLKKHNYQYTSEDQPEINISMEDFKAICNDIISKDKDERLAIPGMVAFRVDMIVVASCLVKYVINNLDIKDVRFSTFALKEGIASQIFAGQEQNFLLQTKDNKK